MLHNYINDTNQRHVRDFNLARMYRASPSPHVSTHIPYSDAVPHHMYRQPADVGHRQSSYPPIPRTRPRGDDGRFVPRVDDEPPVDNRERKICGWCNTTTTSQWRVGPSSGSSRMGTLCNACGINYRRALAKSPGGVLNLDRLSEQMGHTRLSIQKALKRQRKQGAFPAPFKRARPGTRPIERFTQRHYERYVYPPRFPGGGTSHSTLTMLLDNGGVGPASTGGAGPGPRAHEHLAGVDHGMPVARSAPTGRYYGAQMDGGLREESRLPPFQAFIGDLERRTST